MQLFLREINQTASSRNKKYFSSYKENLLERFCCTNQTKLSFLDEEGIDVPPYVCKYSFDPNSGHICLIADEKGYASVIDTFSLASSSNPVKVKAKWRCHMNAIFDVAWSQHAKFATGAGDTTAVLWDANAPEKSLNILRGHSCSVKSVSISRFQPDLIATGSRDGNTLIWDLRCQHGIVGPNLRIQDAHAINDALTPQKKRKRKIAIDGPLIHDSRQAVTSVIFKDSNTLVTSGAMDGTLKLWDLRKVQSASSGKLSKASSSKPIESIRYPGYSNRRRGYTCLTLDSSNTRLFAACTDDTIYEYDMSYYIANENRNPVRRYNGHFGSSFYVKIALSPDDTFLLSGSELSRAYIWNTGNNKDKIYPCASLCTDDDMEQVTSVDWCPNDWTQIVTCSDDSATRFWTLSPKWPADLSSHDGICMKQSPRLQNKVDSESDVLNSSFESSGSSFTTPIKLFERLPESPLSSPSVVDRSSDKSVSLRQRQASLSKWIQKSSPTAKDCVPQKRIQLEQADKENVFVFNSKSQSHKKKVTTRTRKVLSSFNDSVPLEKVKFRSQKPQKRKNFDSEKRNMTIEDFFS